MPAERVQKLLARSGIASRRGAEALIAAGRVTVNGTPATLGQSADPAIDRVAVDGRSVSEPARRRHLAIHKPAGLLSSAHDERGRRSVLSLLPGPEAAGLWPAGRLDVDSEGLMVLTDDGAWANRLLHPEFVPASGRDWLSGLALMRAARTTETRDEPIRVKSSGSIRRRPSRRRPTRPKAFAP